MKFHSIYLLVLFVLSANVLAQQSGGKKIEILNANTIEYDQKIAPDVRRLLGDVAFKHENTIMFCDSAYFHIDKNVVDAFGHIHIHQGDTLHLYGTTARYMGDIKKAEIRQNVKMVDPQTVLTTDYLDYDMVERVAYYTNNGHIVNKENVLDSREGFYYSNTRTFVFKEHVVITNPDYFIESDNLRYNTVSRTAFFQGPTRITSKENFIYCENGWYNTASDISQFNKNAYLLNKSQRLSGDSLYYDRNKGLGKAFQNVEIKDTLQHVILRGNYGKYIEKPESAFLTDKALVIQYGEDSLFLHADTLRSDLDTSNKKILRAFHHVKFFRKDVQGKCDSVSYGFSDSTMRMYGLPVLWYNQSQLNSEVVELKTASGHLDTVYLRNNAFMGSKEDSTLFSQIAGKLMIGYFVNNELMRVDVKGNGQSVYFNREGDQITTMNKAIGSKIIIYMKDRKPERLQFITKVEGTLYPINEAPPEEMMLHGFKWFEDARPLTKEDIFKWTE